MISQRASNVLNISNLLFDAWLCYKANPYAKDNPYGIINMGTAENRFLEDILGKKISDINLSLMDKKLTHYCDLHGLEYFRQSLCNFFRNYMTPEIEIFPDNVFVVNGCGTAIEMLGFTLCDRGEGFIVPAPYYSGFETDLGLRFSTNVFPVHFMKAVGDSVLIDWRKLETSYRELKNEGELVKGILISNPINPFGLTFSTKQLEKMLEFCLMNNIHFVCDEIYLLSIYEKSSRHKNILSLNCINKYRNIIHVIWGFSKDFGLSGFRCGTVITFNKEVQQCLARTSYTSSIPTVSQHVLNEIIKDHDWIDSLQAMNCKLLKSARDIILNDFPGYDIEFINSTSGIFTIVNLKNYLKDDTFESEYQLFEQLLYNGVYLVPGQILNFEKPGWFRITFLPHHQLREGLKRIRLVLNKCRN